jgi:hypothetical protein
MGSREGVKKMRKGKSTNNLKRSSENKNPRGDLLIVVEGDTEENYFESLKRELKSYIPHFIL